MKGLRKRKDSPYWWINYTDATGKPQWESSKSTRKTDAEALLIRRRQEALEGRNPAIKRLSTATLKEFTTEYLKWQKGRQKSFKHTERAVKQLTDDLGNLPLNQFTVKAVEQWQAMRLTEKGNKPATVNRLLAVLKHIFSKAAEYKMISDPIRDGMRSIKLVKLNNARLRYLSSAECAQLISCCPDHLKPIVTTAIYTGMRRGELLSLTWLQVDLGNRLIKLDKTKSCNRREIPVCDTLYQVLSLIPQEKGIPYVFHHKGERYKEVRKSFASALESAGITDFKFHDLRHTFASQLVMSGADIKTVQELLGHKTLAMTMRYAHLADSHRQQAVNRLDKCLNQEPILTKS